jgi:dUTP pyrophosphatase
VDLTVKHIEKIVNVGCIDFSNKDWKLSETKKLGFDDGRVFLSPGPYKVLFNEIICLPKDIMAIGAPRTSLMRCGVTIETGFWDAGYEGRSESLLMVANETGFYVKKNARILQLVFIKLSKVASTGYKGIQSVTDLFFRWRGNGTMCCWFGNNRAGYYCYALPGFSRLVGLCLWILLGRSFP